MLVRAIRIDWEIGLNDDMMRLYTILLSHKLYLLIYGLFYMNNENHRRKYTKHIQSQELHFTKLQANKLLQVSLLNTKSYAFDYKTEIGRSSDILFVKFIKHLFVFGNS